MSSTYWSDPLTHWPIIRGVTKPFLHVCLSVKQPMSANRLMSLDGRTSGNGPKMRLLSVKRPTFLNRLMNPDLIKDCPTARDY